MSYIHVISNYYINVKRTLHSVLHAKHPYPFYCVFVIGQFAIINHQYFYRQRTFRINTRNVPHHIFAINKHIISNDPNPKLKQLLRLFLTPSILEEDTLWVLCGNQTLPATGVCREEYPWNSLRCLQRFQFHHHLSRTWYIITSCCIKLEKSRNPSYNIGLLLYQHRALPVRLSILATQPSNVA